MSQNQKKNSLIRLGWHQVIWFLLLASGARDPFISHQCFPEKAGGCVIEQGQAGAILLRMSKKTETVQGEIWHKQVIFNPLDQERKLWLAYLAPNRNQAPGTYWMQVRINFESSKEHKLSFPILVEGKKYPTEELTLPKKMVEFPPEIVEQINKDNQTLLSAMKEISSACLWETSFMPPVSGEITGVFGAQRIINKVPKNPHNGVDFKANTGDIVRATNNGKVALVYYGYLTGHSLIIDHGCGLYSAYFHLSEILVSPGDNVKKGDSIAKVGASGRASGPHLHFGIRLNESWLDPVSLLQLSQKLEQEVVPAKKER